jgi:hypothetical protein
MINDKRYFSGFNSSLILASIKKFYWRLKSPSFFRPFLSLSSVICKPSKDMHLQDKNKNLAPENR